MSSAEVQQLVDEHRARIVSIVGDADVRLSGSALLDEFAGHDVDVVVLVDDVRTAAARLRESYPPMYETQWRPDWAFFREPGTPQVDVVVTSVGTVGDAHHRRAWELLLENGELRAEYEALMADGMSAEQKWDFFERVVSLLPD